MADGDRDGGEADADDDEGEQDAEAGRATAGADVLAIVEAMAAHWESETHASIMAWAWPLFCTKWARLYEQMVVKRRYERKRDRKRAAQRERDVQHRQDEEWFSQVAVGTD